MKFNFEEILILIVAFLIGWFSRTIIQKNFIEGSQNIEEQAETLQKTPSLCTDPDESVDDCSSTINQHLIPRTPGGIIGILNR